MEYGLRVSADMINEKCSRVLILVLMEYGLREHEIELNAQRPYRVLILVLMEYGLRGFRNIRRLVSIRVLILVLMEYGLRVTSFHI